MDPLPTKSRRIRITLFSYGHSNGPIVQQQQQPRDREAQYQKTLAYNIRHLPNPPRHLRANGATGLSPRLQKEFLQNNTVETFLMKVQDEIANAVKEGCDRLLSAIELDERIKQGSDMEEAGMPADLDARSISGDAAPEGAADIDLIVTICCEEGRHRSVAFVEELARRLAAFKDEDGICRYRQLDIQITHRDIQDHDGNCEQLLGRNKRPSKTQAKTRQRERREKGNRYTSGLGSENELD